MPRGKTSTVLKPKRAGRKPNLGVHVETAREKQFRQERDELQRKLNDAITLGEQYNEERLKHFEDAKRARNAERYAITERDAVFKENSDLRRQLRERELDAERMRGYLDGLEDAKPPTMIEAPRDRKFGTYVDRSRMDPAMGGGYMRDQERPRGWWERPA